MNPDKNPGVDFYDYATEGWRKDNTLDLHPEQSRFGMFDALAEDSRKKLRLLVETVSNHPEARVKNTDAQKVSDLYALAGDMERRNREKALPIAECIKWVEDYDLQHERARFQAESLLNGTSNFINIGCGPDPENSDMNILHIGSAGTALGDRDYYLVKSERNDAILEALRKNITTVLKLAGFSEERASRIWETVLEIDTEIALHQRTREQNRIPELRVNIRDIESIKRDYPDFDWDTYFKTLDINITDRINVIHPEFLSFITSYLKSLPEEKLRDYLLYEQVEAATGLLSEEFEDADFEFNKVFSGVTEKLPRWRKTLGFVNSMLSELVGKLYVEKYFPEENKKYMLELVENLRNALGKHIVNLDWMSESTKEKALKKLEAMNVKIGYPDKWEDYSAIHIDTEKSLAENVREASRYWIRHGLEKLGKPVEKEKWHMSPQTVNAYYSPLNNEICFPAAILQPPYFDMAADDALNYGAIGVVIGHEMTHGFDDSGRKFDASGNQKEWWEEEDTIKFNRLADKLVAQFDNIEIEPGLMANGRFTLGENIADQGGLRVAYTAYRDSLANNSTNYLPSEDTAENGIIDGFTPDQRFYLAYAQVWAENMRDADRARRTQTDPHSLGRNRVNATLRNLDTFFRAFHISHGSPMWLDENERVIIW
ncbi:MAG: M13 family metallopeptidase [Bacteroidales bacterium]|nr:M13 family metallopeptidase [Bacteroidales bacterium]